MRERPKIFEDLSDAMFRELPVNYAFMRPVPLLPVHLAGSDWFRTRQFACEPPFKPVSKIVKTLVTENRGDGGET